MASSFSSSRSLRSGPSSDHPAASTFTADPFTELNAPVQVTLNEFQRLYSSIQSQVFSGKALADTLILREAGEGSDDEDEDAQGKVSLEGLSNAIKTHKQIHFAPYPHLVPLPPLSSTTPTQLVPYQKLNLASTLLILQLVAALPIASLSSAKGKGSKATSSKVTEAEAMMRELKKGVWGGVMSLVQPEDAWVDGQDWLEGELSAVLNRGSAPGKQGGAESAAAAMAAGKEKKRRRIQGWKERVEVMLDICTGIILLSDSRDSKKPIDSIQDARLQEILSGDFLSAKDLVARDDFKGLSGAVFRDQKEKDTVAKLWQGASVSRVVNLNGLTPAQMIAKYPLEKMAQHVGSFFLTRVWLPFQHIHEGSSSSSNSFSFLNPSTPGKILSGADFGGTPTPPPATKVKKPNKTTATPTSSYLSKKTVASIHEDDEEDEELNEGSSLDEIDNDLAAEPAVVELSEKAKGKRSTRLVPSEEEEGEEEEAQDEEFENIVEDSEDDDDEDMIVLVDESSSEEEEEQIFDAEEREEGIREEDLEGLVTRDPAETEGVLRKEITPLRRSVARDERVREKKRAKDAGPALPRQMVQMLEDELAKGKTLEGIVAQQLAHTIASTMVPLPESQPKSFRKPARFASPPKASSSKTAAAVDNETDSEDEDHAEPQLTVSQKAKRTKLVKAEERRILGQDVPDEEDEDAPAVAVEEGENDELLLAKSAVKSNSYVTPSGYRYSTGGNTEGRRSFTPEEDKCILDGIKTLYPKANIWSKIIALHGLNGIESTVLKYRNVQSIKDRARNIKIRILKEGKQPPAYLDVIKTLPAAQQAILDRMNANGNGGQPVNPAFVPPARPAAKPARNDVAEE